MEVCRWNVFQHGVHRGFTAAPTSIKRQTHMRQHTDANSESFSRRGLHQWPTFQRLINVAVFESYPRGHGGRGRIFGTARIRHRGYATISAGVATRQW